jgi:uncharacterized membrane protein
VSQEAQDAQDPQTPDDDSPRSVLSAERLKAFIDAVVAIAMTLLILPLMESVVEIGHEGKSVAEYLHEDYGQLLSFAMSFLLIARFWMAHHRIFDRVERTTNGLVWWQVAWMFTIVWLPVPTAMLGAMDTDTLQKILYIGTLLVTALLLLATQLYLRRHRELHHIPDVALHRGILAEVSLCSLFAIALLVAVLVPDIGYFAMFLMLLSRPAQVALMRLFPA